MSDNGVSVWSAGITVLFSFIIFFNYCWHVRCQVFPKGVTFSHRGYLHDHFAPLARPRAKAVAREALEHPPTGRVQGLVPEKKFPKMDKNDASSNQLTSWRDWLLPCWIMNISKLNEKIFERFIIHNCCASEYCYMKVTWTSLDGCE